MTTIVDRKNFPVSAKWGFHPDPDIGDTPQVNTDIAIAEAMPHVDWLANDIAKKASFQTGAEPEELAAEGYLALVEMAPKWEPSQGTLFNFARKRIVRAMKRFLAEKAQLIKLPEELHFFVYKVRAQEVKLLQTLQRDPTVDEVAEAMGETRDRILEAFRILGFSADVDERELLEYEQPAHEPTQGANLLAAASHLTDLEQQVLDWSVGATGEKLTHAEMAERLDVNARHVGKVLASAKATLRHPAFEGGLV